MKTTIKLIFVITLFCSTATYTFADGDQTNGGRCDLPECSAPTDPPAGGDSFGDEAIEATNSNTVSESNANLSDDHSNNGDFSLIDWLLSFLG